MRCAKQDGQKASWKSHLRFILMSRYYSRSLIFIFKSLLTKLLSPAQNHRRRQRKSTSRHSDQVTTIPLATLLAPITPNLSQ